MQIYKKRERYVGDERRAFFIYLPFSATWGCILPSRAAAGSRC